MSGWGDGGVEGWRRNGGDEKGFGGEDWERNALSVRVEEREKRRGKLRWEGKEAREGSEERE